MPNKPDIEILAQHIDDEHGTFRLRVGQKVHYLTIASDVYDEYTMSQPYLLISLLPELPSSPWTTMTISRGDDGSPTPAISTDKLLSINTQWHKTYIDVLRLHKTRRFRPGTYEVQYQGASAIAKIACFPWEIERIQVETWIYLIMTRYYVQHPNETPIMPRFLGHLTENGRIMGLLVEKVAGETARVDDLDACQSALRKLHKLGVVHGDASPDNFIIDHGSDGGIHLIDFEKSVGYDEKLAQAELESLSAQLTGDAG